MSFRQRFAAGGLPRLWPAAPQCCSGEVASLAVSAPSGQVRMKLGCWRFRARIRTRASTNAHKHVSAALSSVRPVRSRCGCRLEAADRSHGVDACVRALPRQIWAAGPHVTVRGFPGFRAQYAPAREFCTPMEWIGRLIASGHQSSIPTRRRRRRQEQCNSAKQQCAQKATDFTLLCR